MDKILNPEEFKEVEWNEKSSIKPMYKKPAENTITLLEVDADEKPKEKQQEGLKNGKDWKLKYYYLENIKMYRYLGVDFEEENLHLDDTLVFQFPATMKEKLRKYFRILKLINEKHLLIYRLTQRTCLVTPIIDSEFNSCIALTWE